MTYKTGFAMMFNDEEYEKEREGTLVLKTNFVKWITTSKVGDVIEYWHGFLAEDRDPSKRKSRRANIIGSLFWAASSIPRTPNPELGSTWGYGLNLLQLTQRKERDGTYTYLARKIKDLPESSRSMYEKTLLGN
jgi:hypothetical protein